jgi:hypothetical protein
LIKLTYSPFILTLFLISSCVSLTNYEPAAVTNAVTNISDTAATLNGTVNANGNSTMVTFEYGVDTSYGTTVTAAQSAALLPV